MSVKETILCYMGEELEHIFFNIPSNLFLTMNEIRLRVGKPVIVVCGGKEYFLDKDGQLLLESERAYKADLLQLQKVLALVSEHSFYAFSEEVKNGYITIRGGHRIGLTGKVVMENGFVKTIKNFNGLNLRISHQIKGCANDVMQHIVSNEQVLHTMIISPPSCGKTTLLRDIVRQISDGKKGVLKGQAVSVVDERSEIAGCYMGIPQNDVGIRTDVLDGCKKAEGMQMLLRSMSPRVIALDEIGKHEDIYAIDDVINAGVSIVCTVHGSSIDDVLKKPVLSQLIHKKIFQRFIVLLNKGEVKGIFDENFNQINTDKGRGEQDDN